MEVSIFFVFSEHLQTCFLFIMTVTYHQGSIGSYLINNEHFSECLNLGTLFGLACSMYSFIICLPPHIVLGS